jgi:uncharacterized protein (TIGR03437 family)
MTNPIDPVIKTCPTSTPQLKTSFIGLAPGQVGLEQVNFVVPANQQPGDWPLFIASASGYSPYVLLPVR